MTLLSEHKQVGTFVPDFSQVLKVTRRERPDRPVLMELFMNGSIYRDAIGPVEVARLAALPESGGMIQLKGFAALGYDYATLPASAFRFPSPERHHQQSISLNEGGLIKDHASFESFAWPDPDEFVMRPLIRAAEEAPEGLNVLVIGPGGVLENAISICGYDNLCIMLYDAPELVADIFDAIGSRIVRYYQRALEHDIVGGIWANDDWGFKTQPMLTVEQMTRLPGAWHRRIAAVAHAAGKPCVMHSCGQLVELMDFIIDDIGHDAKHSWEDTILPVEEAYDRWGRRIGIIGGIDMDFMCRSTPQAVRARAQALLDQTEKRGGYALGTGNSVPDYIPRENYIAMIEAAWERR